ncbi:RtcB family protein [Chlorobaculum thiosulfatiphilum]|uniref:RtcB family protein n=1 Tax=Chlorobaculum thiosulfatiphilum TaxID=115852 RepID=UPI001FEA83C7|nr:RtcB family protein [Chlorobaculum thiosulfatiphilum]
MSCTKVRREVQGNQLRRELEAMGVSVQAGSMQSLAEEAPAAYKDIGEVTLRPLPSTSSTSSTQSIPSTCRLPGKAGFSCFSP